MSTLRVIKISNLNEDGAVELTKGAVLPAEQQIVDPNGNNAIQISTSAGVVTATKFIGSGSGITGLTGTPTGRALGLILVG
jgi:hypothetical protein|tara:strand:- start:218 stop:460 length:243 start_codon:yes stop_codon:yes gene_type:complete